MSMTNMQLIETFHRMLRIRHFEEKVMDFVAKGVLPGAAHLSIGEEAQMVGACMALRDDDYELGTHRSHGHCIAKGADIKPLMAELLGKVTGVNRGKGGSMHLADFSVGSLGETSIVGSGLPVAAGAALGIKLKGEDKVVLCFFGDGASSQGTFHESMNLAAIWKLPVIYQCENNLYAATTDARYSVSIRDIADRAKGYDVPGMVVDGQDPIAVFEVVTEATKRARAGEGPSLVEAKTYRYRGHSEGALFEALESSGYRSRQEYEEWLKRDPIVLFHDRLIQVGVLSEQEAGAIDQEERERVEEAAKFALESPFPDPAEAFSGVYRNPIVVD
jgi:pyruvate dehydrogenase E1 component alpha subunit